ncbi:MAG: multicopper oxidase family protein [Solirubrobacterales bacterium]
MISIAIAGVAIARSDNVGSAGGGMAMGSMSGGSMEHMSPLPVDGIKNAPASQGGTLLKPTMSDGVAVYRLNARPVWWTIFGGQRVTAYAYNGIVPGPQIRVKNGQRVRIEFKNDLPEPTTMHWHGVGVPNSQDGVPGVTQKNIEPGESYAYEFTAKPAGNPTGGGTFMYHTHTDEDRQMPMGLYGTLIIDPPSGAQQYSVDKTLVFSEWSSDPGTGRSRGVMQMEGMLPNFFTINGKSFPDTGSVNVQPGKKVLFRLVNAGQLAHPIHLHGTSFRVIARDGHAVQNGAVERRDTLTLESGERADIEFTEPPGKWILHCHIGHHLTNDGEGPGGLLMVVNSKTNNR